jgi:putative membrane protein
MSKSFGEEQAYLAAERTYLAHVRTALTLLIAGLTIVRFFGQNHFIILGWIFVALGATLLAVGHLRWKASLKRIETISQKNP